MSTVLPARATAALKTADRLARQMGARFEVVPEWRDAFIRREQRAGRV